MRLLTPRRGCGGRRHGARCCQLQRTPAIVLLQIGHPFLGAIDCSDLARRVTGPRRFFRDCGVHPFLYTIRHGCTARDYLLVELSHTVI